MPPESALGTDHKIEGPFIFLLSAFQSPMFDFRLHCNVPFHLLYRWTCPLEV